MSDEDREITLTADTVAAVMADPALADGLERAGERGTDALVAWLDEHGLRWREGGSDPLAAIADAAAAAGLVFEPLPPLDDERERARRARERRQRQRRGRR